MNIVSVLSIVVIIIKSSPTIWWRFFALKTIRPTSRPIAMGLCRV